MGDLTPVTTRLNRWMLGVLLAGVISLILRAYL